MKIFQRRRRLTFQNIFYLVVIVILLYIINESRVQLAQCENKFQLSDIGKRDVVEANNRERIVQKKNTIRGMDDNPKNRDKLTIDEIQKFRHLKLRNGCRNVGIRKLDLNNTEDLNNAVNHKVSMDTVYWSDEFKFTVSIIHKIGSKNWRILFSRLRGRTKATVEGEYLSLVKDKYEVKKRLMEYYNILFVRNPLTRVVSGYRDKFEGKTVPEYTDVGQVIIQRYRNIYSANELKKASEITFNEFVMFLLDMDVNKTETIDRHWIPIVYRGRPCELDYDFIGRLETVDRDIPYLYSHLGFDKVVTYNKGQQRKSSESILLKRYYQKLPEDLFRRLVNLYREDFLLFGYKIPNDQVDFDELLLSV
ncbi:carbohydrate sulfotransferase 14-like [Antedon mediterranea]|uniref:carbohydrate sulfotransferase 14-like n=1 Tax=Antedon mediterranea TaxID=105859 RepID=UPI003AF85CC4